MNVKELRESGYIIMECVAGSKMYGLDTPESDTDIRGVYMLPSEIKNGLLPYKDEISDEGQDIKFYELEKFLKLAINNNPNILELLFCDELIFSTPIWDELYKNRKMFVSQKAKHTFLGYAYSQLKRAKGKNKKVHDTDKYMTENSIIDLMNMYTNGLLTECFLQQHISKHLFNHIKKTTSMPNSITNADFESQHNSMWRNESLSILLKPKLEDFCYTVGYNNFHNLDGEPGMRPDKCHPGLYKLVDLTKINHFENIYKMYTNGNGMIKNNQVVVKSISKKRELEDFCGIVSIHQDSYTKALKEYESFWEWFLHRNTERWKTQMSGEMDYDSKSLSHNIRLLMSAENIALKGEPAIKFDVYNNGFLREVKKGKFTYDELLKIVKELETRCKISFDENKINLQHSADLEKINELYLKITK